MKHLANKHTLVALLSLAIVSAISLPSHAQFGGGGADDEERLQKLEKKVHLLGKFMLDLKKSPLADMQNSQVSVFRLQYIRASSAADTISALLGNEGFRLAIEEKSNQLIVSAPAEISKAIGDLLQKIDAASAQKNVSIATSQKQAAPKNLQVHTFWLADGLYGDLTGQRLPRSVIEALNKIGMPNPGIVAQSTTSLITKSINDISMSENFMHATFKDQGEHLFTSQNKLSLNKDQRIELHVKIAILKSTAKKNACELQGSVTSPLGHFMILGTSNYVVENSDAKNPATSRFAFVIQVVEASSFAPKRSSNSTRVPDIDPSEAVRSSKNTKDPEVNPFENERSSKITEESEFDPFADPIQPNQKPPTKK